MGDTVWSLIFQYLIKGVVIPKRHVKKNKKYMNN